MIILKKINNNFALALDEAGKEVVAYGRGIGFPKTPYNLEDEGNIDRVFREINEGQLSAISSIPEDLLDITASLVDEASMVLGCKLNGNLVFTLADHIQFAIERICEGIDIENPLSFDIELVYPPEYELGCRCVDAIAEKTSIRLPSSEAGMIALHIVSAQAEGGSHTQNIQDAMRSAKLIEQVGEIIQCELGIDADASSYTYARFVSHLRYLLKRIEKSSEQRERETSGSNVEQMRSIDLINHIKLGFTREYRCARRIRNLIEDACEEHLDSSEFLYLMLYLTRLGS